MPEDSRFAKEQVDQLQAEIERLKDRVDQLEVSNAALRERYRRLRQRRVVRAGLAVAESWARLKARIQRRPGAGSRLARLSREDVVAGVLKSRPHVYPHEGPLVRIVVLTRNGYQHMLHLLEGLGSSTAYESFEVVVVDNNSTDGSRELYGRDWGFPLSVVENPVNVSFSEGCNQGAEGSGSEYLLFLNNDIEPIGPEWLGAMVEALERDGGAAAAGAVLVYPEEARSPFTVQHRGIGFSRVDGVPLPFNLGGDDPQDENLTETRRVAAATAACLLVRTASFQGSGGFDEGYVYGLEDVDLCLRLQEGGESILVVGDAVLFHHESATQDRSDRSPLMARRRSNRVRFVERWSPVLSRNMKLEAVGASERMWAPDLRHKVAITLTEDRATAGWGDWYTAHELGDAMEQEGWEVVYAEAREGRWYELPDDVALVVSLLDRYDVSRAPPDAVTVAWVRNWTDRWVDRAWFQKYDVVLPSSAVSSRLVLEGGATPPAVIPLATNPDRFYPRPENLSYRCDYTFTGHYWGVARSIIEDLRVSPDEAFTMYGKGWDQVPNVSRYWRGKLPYEELPELYSSAKIVLDDTAGPTLPYGAVNSRVFDAVACGSLVISNNELGSEELFDGLLPTYRDGDELRTLLDEYLLDDSHRRETAEQLRRVVLALHTYRRRASQIPAAVEETLSRPRIAIKIGPPNHETANTWGDTHFARSFAKSLRRLGWRTRIDLLPEWDQPDRQDVDVALHIRGLRRYAPRPAHFNVLWIISHPDDVMPEECEKYDVVFVASESFAEELSSRVTVPVHVLLQATDPQRFKPEEPDPSLATEVLFVGNSRKKRRPIVDAAIAAGLPLSIYGSDWAGLVPDQYVKGEYFPNESLSKLYASAGVVLNDHWPDMREQGFVSNRVFDVLACGVPLVTDGPLPEELQNELPVFIYEQGADLLELTREAASLSRNQRLAASHRIAESHSFDNRSTLFTEILSSVEDSIAKSLHRELRASQ